MQQEQVIPKQLKKYKSSRKVNLKKLRIKKWNKNVIFWIVTGLILLSTLIIAIILFIIFKRIEIFYIMIVPFPWIIFPWFSIWIKLFSGDKNNKSNRNSKY